MDWQQKAYALNALTEIKIRIRKPGDWYVDQAVEIKDAHCLVGEYGNGETPEDAINNHWELLIEKIGQRYLVTRAMGEDRRAVRWNGFMWIDVKEPAAQAVA